MTSRPPNPPPKPFANEVPNVRGPQDAAKPVMIDLGDQAGPLVADAPAVPDGAAPPAHFSAPRQVGRVALMFWGALGALVSLGLGVWVWDFVQGALARSPFLGAAAAIAAGAAVLAGLVAALREMAAIARLRRIGRLHRAAAGAAADADMSQARRVVAQLRQMALTRHEMRWSVARFDDQSADQPDASGLLALAEVSFLTSPDQQAEAQIDLAAKRVAAVTALVPLALVDVIVVLAVNLRMIRRIAEIYGGRPGLISSARLLRAVMGHLIATGAVAIGEDMLEPLLGSTLLGKLSRRFGEGLVNGALTVRVGVAALETCRPMPFAARARPKTGQLIKRSLASLITGP